MKPIAAKKKLPHVLLIAVSAILIVVQFFTGERTVDFHYYDTVYVFGLSQVLLFLSTLLALEFLIYNFFDSLMYSKTISWIQVITTLYTSFFLTIILFQTYDSLTGVPRKYLDRNENLEIVQKILFYHLLGFLGSIAIFFINLFIGMVFRTFRRS